MVNRMKAWQGSLGVSAYRGIVSGDYEVLRPVSNSISGRYMHYALRSRHMVGEYRVRSTGIRPSQWRLYWDQMGDIRITLPPLQEQERISDYLDHEIAQIDTLIREQQQLVEMLRERRAAVSTEEIDSVASLTTGQRLKHVVTGVTQGWSPQCYPWPADGVETWGVLKAGAANGGVFRPYENKELPEDQAPRPDRVVQRGHLVVSRANTRDLVGSAAVVEGDFPRLMLSDKLYAFDLDETQADPVYVATVLGTPRLRGLIELEATGASPSMQNVSQDDILNLPMDLPAVDVQHQVVSRIREQNGQIDTLIAESERLIELSQERRAALITAAVTGQIDVSQES
ncbi:restriction endonuclease subunit S [Streptomyces sp. I6]|nr:restriction endonuclease subunit S [Streptomyces sp. I6]